MNKKIFISGQNGLIGTSLSNALKDKGYDVTAIDRNAFKMEAGHFLSFIESADIIINLAGAPIIRRWTNKYKDELFNSRVLTTRKLVNAIQLMGKKPAQFISVSAVGIYNDVGIKTEDSDTATNSFLSQLSLAWEYEASLASTYTLTAICRMGVVLSKNGGALKTMMPLFKVGLGGKIAKGTQIMSWIHIDDVVRALLFLIEHKLSGVYNFTAPNPVNNSDFTSALAKTLKTPAFFTVPEFVLKVVYGEGAVVLTQGQHVLPQNLTDKGFKFNYPTIKQALEELKKY
ncbi:MAG: TIGR01777 family oxidoreductase [Bacteroidales bacterium]|nr:TIGR01777 family oxidoreductase [Bacteroidales bacterium]